MQGGNSELRTVFLTLRQTLHRSGQELWCQLLCLLDAASYKEQAEHLTTRDSRQTTIGIISRSDYVLSVECQVEMKVRSFAWNTS